MKTRDKKTKRKSKGPSPNPLRVDPTRTTMIRKALAAELSRRFARLRLALDELVVRDDVFGLGTATFNAFCPTGKGGGIDPTCSPGGVRKSAPVVKEKKGRKSKAQIQVSDDDPRPTEWLEKEHEEQSKSIRHLEDRIVLLKAVPESVSSPNQIEYLQQDLSRLRGEANILESKIKRRKETSSNMERLGVDEETIASIVGAPDNAKVYINASWHDEAQRGTTIKASVSHPDFSAHRTIYIDKEGNKVIHNDSFFVREGAKGKGTGSQVFHDSVVNLQEEGFDRVETWAARGSGMNGYYSWPRMGYDQKISDFRDKRTREKIKKAFPEAKSVLDVMSTPEGRKWWKKNGKNMRKATFDLKEGSRSWQVHEAYLAERASRSSPTGNVFYPTYNVEPDNEDDIPPDSLEDAEEIEVDADGEVIVGTRGLLLNAEGDRQAWRFDTDAEKLKKFQEWIKKYVLIWVIGNDEERLWERYVQRGYNLGAGRAFADVKKAGGISEERLPFYLDSREQFLRSAFGSPVAVEKVKLLVSRAFTDLKGVTEAMGTQMTRTLADGLVQGVSPRELGRRLAKDVTGIGKVRATMIARTEIIRAHAEGQLDALKKLGVEEVGAQVEWSTTGDHKVCPMCRPLQGVVLKIDEARGMLPRHPNCRCAWIPAGLGEDDKGQLKAKERVKTAVRRSVAAGSKKDRWSPKVLNAFCPTGKGGGIDPTCSPKFTAKETPFPTASHEDIQRVGEATLKSGLGIMDAQTRDVPLSAIVGTQKKLWPKRVQEYIDNPDREAKGMPTATKFGGKYYLTEGHHRVSAAIARGKDTLEMNVYDLDEVLEGTLNLSPELVAFSRFLSGDTQ